MQLYQAGHITQTVDCCGMSQLQLSSTVEITW